MKMSTVLTPALGGWEKPIYDAEVIAYRLEEAGRTLLSLPNAGCFPSGYRSFWPDGAAIAAEAYGYGDECSIRPPMPEPQHITRMDEALRWVTLISPDRRVHRRIVLMRALVNPVNERHKWSWRKIGKALGADHRAIQRWHDQGIDWIVQALYDQQLAGASWAVLYQEERSKRSA